MNITTCMRFAVSQATHHHNSHTRSSTQSQASAFTFSVAAARLTTFVFAASSCLGVTLDLEPVSFWGRAFSFPSSTFGFGSAAAFAGQTKGGAGCLPSVKQA